MKLSKDGAADLLKKYRWNQVQLVHQKNSRRGVPKKALKEEYSLTIKLFSFLTGETPTVEEIDQIVND